MTNDRNDHKGSVERRTLDVDTSRILPNTADPTGGATNLATRPRAGNISSDTRAGRPR